MKKKLKKTPIREKTQQNIYKQKKIIKKREKIKKKRKTKIAITIKLNKIEIRHKGLYDLDTLYKKIRHWFSEREYEFNEERYKDKIADYGTEAEHKWNGELWVNNFVQYNIKIETKFYGVKEFEADYHGEKRKVNNGQLFIVMNGIVTFDYLNNFESKQAKYFLNLLINKIFKKYYEIKYIDKLDYDVYRLQTLIKEELHMETASNAY